MPTCKGLIDVFGDTARNALGNLHQYNIGNAPKIINNYSIYDLWHILFAFDNRTAKDNKFLEKFSIEKLDIANERNKKGEEPKLKPVSRCTPLPAGGCRNRLEGRAGPREVRNLHHSGTAWEGRLERVRAPYAT